VRAEQALLAFAAAVFVFHHLPALARSAGDWVDLVTPFAAVGAAAAVLRALGAGTPAIALALVAGVLYVDGHGIHLAANAIANEGPIGAAERVAHFWDERFGHIEWHLGWIGLLSSFCLAEAAAAAPRTDTVRSRRGLDPAAFVTVALLGFTLFTSTIEGGTWWLALAGAVAFAAWALRRPRSVVTTCAAAFVVASLLIAVWAVWQGGVPQFSEVGLL
jgi:hypothetical protein